MGGRWPIIAASPGLLELLPLEATLSVISSSIALHPSPQRRRRGWLDLGGRWEFGYDDGNVGLQRGWHEDATPYQHTIVVPYPPESRLSGLGDPAPHPVVWYRRTFRLSDVGGFERGRRLLLHFGAVDYAADVWLNGRLVGRHIGGHSSFSFDVGDALGAADDQVLVVRAEDQPADLGQPRGKQHWEDEPSAIWYHRTTGMWQPVWLEAVGGTYLDQMSWTADSRPGRLGWQLRLNRAPDERLRLRLRLSVGGSLLVDDTYSVDQQESGREVDFGSGLRHRAGQALLWSAERPNLIDVELALEGGAGKILDEVNSYAGLRSVETADGLYLVNGNPTYLRMVLAQGYWPDSHLAAPNEVALRREVEHIKALGFNGVRIHQKVEDPRFLYWCDRLGLYVWSEMANAYSFSERAVERFTREWLEVVRRDSSHPSIISWVPFNESWGVPEVASDRAQQEFVRGIYHLTKALDPTRPVIGNDGWEHVSGDVWTIHDYGPDGAGLRERYGSREAVERALHGRPQHRRTMVEDMPWAGEPVVLSEFGGITFTPRAGERWFGYGSVSSEADFARKFEELVSAVLDCPALAGFCYTQLADTEQETNGLLYADRTPKLPFAQVRPIITRPSKGIPGDSIGVSQKAALDMANGGTGEPPDRPGTGEPSD